MLTKRRIAATCILLLLLGVTAFYQDRAVAQKADGQSPNSKSPEGWVDEIEQVFIRSEECKQCHDRHYEEWKGAREQTPGENLDFRIVSPDGQVRWMSISWQPMYAAEGNYLGYRTSARDVTERRALREQLRLHAEHLEQLVQERTARLRQLEQRQRQMEKLAALGQLAAGVAHEINNPLAGMRNAFELIKSSLSRDHEHYELLELIDREIERISAIIHQMYQLYRRSPQQPAPFSLSRIVGEVTYLLETQAQKSGVKLRWKGSDDPLEVVLAEGEVKQIL